jgi:ABC-type sugar transport system substrate-binding protein
MGLLYESEGKMSEGSDEKQSPEEEPGLLQGGPVSRRGFLKMAAVGGAAVGLGAGLGGLIAACGSGATTTTAATASSTTAASTATTAAASTTTAASTGTTVSAGATNVGPKKVIALIPWSFTFGTAALLLATAQQFMADRGWDLTIHDANNSYANVLGITQQAIAQKPDAIILMAVWNKMANSTYQAVADAKIPLFSLEEAPDPRALCNVSVDGGTDMTLEAEYFCKAINYKGNIITATQHDEYWIDIKSNILMQTIAKYPNIKVLQDVRPDHSNDTLSLKNVMTAVLNANSAPGSIAGAIAAWGDPGLGITQAVMDAKRYEVKVATEDAIEASLQNMVGPNPVVIYDTKRDESPKVLTLIKVMTDYWTGADTSLGRNILVPSVAITDAATAQKWIPFLDDFSKNGKAALTTTTTA